MEDKKNDNTDIPSDPNKENKECDFLTGKCPYEGSVEPCENCQ